ncbi:MAG TPA: ATP-dependent helicase C-terminal domain-containing protein [Tepidisphaeraceae bacterium]|jgi:ATP-dependent helicase HrpB|nr:ATP-dependent helicase C-terminal domain-containing protein [Tepidisphaeraceae bacterium]
MTPLPIDSHLPEIVAKVRAARSLVLVAPPGAGKTTRVPPAILRAGLLSAGHPNLVMLQPRRVAARASAQRIADENGWVLGREVGYHIRFERRIGPETRLRVLTEGILTRQLLEDPFLEGTGAVLLDEFHERSLHTDMSIAMLREIRQTVRDDLILIVMSATLEAEPVAKFLGDCPIVRTEGRTYPIQLTYAHAAPAGRSQDIPDRVADALSDLLTGIDSTSPDNTAIRSSPPPASFSPPLPASPRLRVPASASPPANDPGDILIFLPGVEEIRRTAQRLESLAQRQDLLLVPLHGSLTGDEQFAALRPASRRKVILSTNIAETSLTIEGVRTVIDSGLARVAGYDPQRGLDRLELVRISKASATQRAGRAGRTAPGRCVRLWSQQEDRAMPDFETPEIQRVDLCGTVLALHAWGKTNPRAFGWYDPPPEQTLAAAERLLAMLGALTSEADGRITPIGTRLLSLPAHPRLGRLLLAAAEQGLLPEGAAVAALLSEKDIVRPSDYDPSAMFRPAVQASSDVLIRLDLLARAEQDRFGPGARSLRIDVGAAWQVARARDELERLGSRLLPPGARAPARRSANEPPDEDALLKLPLLAYPDRVARRRGADPDAAVMVGGGGVRLARESAVKQAEFFLALDARQDERRITREALVRVASAIDVRWLEELFPESIRRERSVVFDPQRQRVVGIHSIFYRDLLLREDRNAPVDPEQAQYVLAAALRPRAGEIFAADEPAANWLARLALLRQAMPEHPWPDPSPEALGELLASALHGKKGLDDLKGVPLLQLLQGTLHYPLDRLLEENAPQEIEVPSGSRIRVQYAPGQPPILAVRLQELFGWTDTPRVANGRVPVLLHLLGPNFRPVQITGDLRSFWTTTYFQVRKDLRIRYPKHSWPEDPLTAKPEAKGTRRR